ncbi:hypothetical protein SALB1_1988 [Salinisphaera sp. LB1]|nr:hypothetical protein SALB1_1988 [Salinisphaera sp. LB1]
MLKAALQANIAAIRRASNQCPLLGATCVEGTQGRVPWRVDSTVIDSPIRAPTVAARPAKVTP